MGARTPQLRLARSNLDRDVLMLAGQLLRQAVLQARRRGLISMNDGAELNASLDHASEGTR